MKKNTIVLIAILLVAFLIVPTIGTTGGEAKPTEPVVYDMAKFANSNYVLTETLSINYRHWDAGTMTIYMYNPSGTLVSTWSVSNNYPGTGTKTFVANQVGQWKMKAVSTYGGTWYSFATVFNSVDTASFSQDYYLTDHQLVIQYKHWSLQNMYIYLYDPDDTDHARIGYSVPRNVGQTSSLYYPIDNDLAGVWRVQFQGYNYGSDTAKVRFIEIARGFNENYDENDNKYAGTYSKFDLPITDDAAGIGASISYEAHSQEYTASNDAAIITGYITTVCQDIERPAYNRLMSTIVQIEKCQWNSGVYGRQYGSSSGIDDSKIIFEDDPNWCASYNLKYDMSDAYAEVVGDVALLGLKTALLPGLGAYKMGAITIDTIAKVGLYGQSLIGVMKKLSDVSYSPDNANYGTGDKHAEVVWQTTGSTIYETESWNRVQFYIRDTDQNSNGYCFKIFMTELFDDGIPSQIGNTNFIYVCVT